MDFRNADKLLEKLKTIDLPATYSNQHKLIMDTELLFAEIKVILISETSYENEKKWETFKNQIQKHCSRKYPFSDYIQELTDVRNKLLTGKTLDSILNPMTKKDLHGNYLLSASWCGPCRTIKSELQNLPPEKRALIQVLDFDDNVELFRELGVKAVPRFAIFDSGEQVEMVSGVKEISDKIVTITEQT